MTRPLKIVVSGPVGAGKTTFIRTLSETPVLDTEAEPSEDIGKATTTVAFDFGTMHLDDLPVHLYGTPGQDRFDFMWDILCQGALGLVMLVAGDRPGDFPKARSIFEFVTSRHPVPFIIGVTRQDLERVWEPEDVADYFELPTSHVVGLNATDAEQSTLTLVRMLELIQDITPIRRTA
ncbi:GTP-binding protein [Deinococcus yavapaiensis]|uniref:GTPase n=1 Tax=Deinococcus yavapaiensis KR-236 TaxID=694435 RepID=A0A318SAX0_9DEIO|nr:ATP/GTP-binding protein [Deinococcus yavapaiensis]PYE53759.1 hypothetical protein DES52_10717 [Deinococcus yavapaiensis KR-236]